jgi:hypothetical protein
MVDSLHPRLPIYSKFDESGMKTVIYAARRCRHRANPQFVRSMPDASFL